MLDNNVYNLLVQLVQEHKSLWRIKNNYHIDVNESDECADFWKKMEADKEQHITELVSLLKKNLP